MAADAWSRTYRSRALTYAVSDGAIESRSGMRLLPDRVAADWPATQRLPTLGNAPSAAVLQDTLAGIERRYGSATADVVAMQLELPRP